MLALLALMSAHAESYVMADAGITLDLPSSWEMTRWSDWDFKGKTGDGTVAIEAWYTAFQVPIDKASTEGWAPAYRERLEEMRAIGVTREDVVIADVAGRPTARTTMRFTLDKGGPKGAMFVAAFPVEGKVMHVATLAVGPNVTKASNALDTLLARLTIQKAAAATIALGGEVQSELGFSTTLPEGWRRPLPSEEADANKALADIVIGPKDPDSCLRAIRPLPSGEADLMLFCSESWKTGILDEDSFLDQEALLKQRFFGKAADRIPAADRLARNDRLGILLAPEINGHDLRIAALPYDRGTLVGWAVGQPGSGESLTSALRATTMSLAFTGPEGGAAIYEVGEWMVHTFTYNPFHPAVLGAGFGMVAILAGFGWLVFRKPAQPQM